MIIALGSRFGAAEETGDARLKELRERRSRRRFVSEEWRWRKN
ncbi:hypothetical protein E2C01_097398 [Portunus trituberculatus]|uniref:Uncharacterized protein n=1 Tax=Portunus trituberculatus TaxID=210409 RepID=A0A5B7K0B7_PORTR|nr:hypothetical protein [Portunus trituberculatus]